MTKEATDIVSALKDKQDKTTKSLAQLELLTAHLEAAPEPVPASVVDHYVTLKDTTAYSLAVERIARHNTRLGRHSDALAMADALEEQHRPFVQLGVALGMLDPRR